MQPYMNISDKLKLLSFLVKFHLEQREMDSASAAQEHHEIVIVGGGICGLATALALHRKGLRSVVLEKSESLTSTGAAIGVLANGWRALDHLGVADHLRQKTILIQGARDVSIDQGTQEHFQFRSGEARCCLKRSDLIEALADALPPETIRFGCQIVSLEMDPQNIYPTLHSSDGKSIRAKVLLGCDGSKSIVGDFLRLKPTRLSALCAVRGLTYYPNGHTFAQEVVRMHRNRTRFGQIPIDDKLVYWFVTQPSTQFDAKFPNDPELIKQATLEIVSGFPADVIEMIQGSDLDALSLTHLRYRAPWEILVGRFSKGPIAVAGDAMHVMCPFLGQGGSAGIEDSVVLARNLAQKIGSDDMCGREEQNMANKIAEALHQFVEERRMRVVRLSTQTYLTGLIMETTSTVVKYICVALIAILFSDRSGHTKYDCGQL